MAKLDIKIYPDKALRKKASLISKVDKSLEKFSQDMIETMRSSKGVGLAAPQVGISKRLIVIEAMGKEDSPLVLINPKIFKKKGRSSFCEGCLSLPEITADVVRSEKIVVQALNLKGEPVKIEADGLLSRVIQHEIDHLDGVLFIDRVGFWKRRKMTKKFSSKVYVEL